MFLLLGAVLLLLAVGSAAEPQVPGPVAEAKPEGLASEKSGPDLFAYGLISSIKTPRGTGTRRTAFTSGATRACRCRWRNDDSGMEVSERPGHPAVGDPAAIGRGHASRS